MKQKGLVEYDFGKKGTGGRGQNNRDKSRNAQFG
jgi:hypothetical protein